MKPEQLLMNLSTYPCYMRGKETYQEANKRVYEAKLEMIKKAKDEWNKAQRELCANNAIVDHLIDKVYTVNKDSILNAPKS